MRALLVAYLAMTVAACGGGGTEQPCIDRPITIQLFGDSTMNGVDGANPANTSGSTPQTALQARYDAKYGAGAVLVENRARNSTDLRMLMTGTDGLNAPWPGSATADVLVVNHGIVSRHRPLAEYAELLRQLASAVPAERLVFETPNPNKAIGATRDLSVAPYAAVMRAVAADYGVLLADTYQYLIADPTWRTLLIPDAHHPAEWVYPMIVEHSLGPVVDIAVERLRCEK